jgi:centrosomal CEP192-like protein
MIATDSAFGAPQSVSVSGTGTLVSAISFSPSSLTFPVTKAGASSATQVVTVSNPSALPMAVSTYLFSGANAGEFTMPSKTCGPVLAANSSCTLTIAFKPTTSGPASASIVATDSASGTPQTLPLTGTGK